MSISPSCLVDKLCQVADVEACRRLRSASSSSLIVGRTRLSTVRDRAFPVAAACIWNNLPQHVTSAHSLLVVVTPQESRLISSPFPIPVRDHVSHSDTCHFNHLIVHVTYLHFRTFPCCPASVIRRRYRYVSPNSSAVHSSL